MNEVTFEDFLKLDIRVGVITKSQKVPKSEKLLQLEVNFGEMGTRTILAGIGKDFDSDSITGTQVVAVLNLAPRKMMGVESHGMLLAAHGAARLCLVQCLGAELGAKVG